MRHDFLKIVTISLSAALTVSFAVDFNVLPGSVLSKSFGGTKSDIQALTDGIGVSVIKNNEIGNGSNQTDPLLLAIELRKLGYKHMEECKSEENYFYSCVEDKASPEDVKKIRSIKEKLGQKADIPDPEYLRIMRDSVLYWNFDDLNGMYNVADMAQSGYSDDSGAFSGGSTLDAGFIGRGAYIYGADADSAVIAQNSPDVNMHGESSFTVTAWFKEDPSTYDPSRYAIVFNKETQYEVALNEGKVKFALRTTSGEWYWIDSGFSYVPGKWNFVSLTYDGNKATLFFNNQAFSVPYSGTIIERDRDIDAPFKIGNRMCCPEWISGWIDEVRIFKKPLSIDDVRIIMNHDLIRKNN